MLNKDYKSKLYNYAKKRLGMRDYTRGWMKGRCPSCGREDKYGLNIYGNRTNCFRCGYHPTPFQLVLELEGLNDYLEVKKFLNLYGGEEYLEPVIKRIERIDTVLPEGFKSLKVGNNFIAKQARKYIKSRGFDIEDMSYKGWGYGTKGTYLGYIIIPFYINGKLVYYNTRIFMGSGPKYNNPSIEEFGIGKSLVIYNLDALGLYDEICLLEGVFNAETVGENAIAMGGKKVSDYQISIIVKSPVKFVTLILDPDALEDSIRVAKELSYHKKVRIIQLPEDKDANDLGHEETNSLIKQVGWMSYNDITKLGNEKRTRHTYN